MFLKIVTKFNNFSLFKIYRDLEFWSNIKILVPNSPRQIYKECHKTIMKKAFSLAQAENTQFYTIRLKFESEDGNIYKR